MARPRLELLARHAASLSSKILRIARWQRELTYEKNRILFGQEGSFPPAFVERVNQKTAAKRSWPSSSRDKVVQGEPCGYDVVIDRISQDVRFIGRG